MEVAAWILSSPVKDREQVPLNVEIMYDHIVQQIASNSWAPLLSRFTRSGLHPSKHLPKVAAGKQ